MTKTISLLGSTGSIGRQTLQVARELGLSVAALTANRQVDLLEQQAREFHPALAVLYDRDAARELRLRLSDTDIRVEAGPEGLLLAAQLPQADTVVTAVMGSVGLEPTLAAIRQKKRIALANKETLVCAGELVMAEAERCGADIVPVDSEHSAIFQCLNGENRSQLKKILLTASGGPFRGKKLEDLKNIQVEDALKHPNWAMGRKITIDSSTLVNKGLEMMEAKWLFGVEPKDIQIVVQPKSIIHSMVEFVDGAVIAQLGTPDMKLPIQYALYYPERRFLPGDRLDFWKLQEITFEKPDMETFRGLKLAFDAAAAGGSMPTVYNAANERAVAKFLDRKIAYLQIPEIIETCMGHHTVKENPSVEEILDTEQAVYEFIESRW